MEVIMQHACRVAMGTLAWAIATSSVALAAGDPGADGADQAQDGSRRAAAATDGAHHASAPAPAPPTAAEANAELSAPGMPRNEGADWATRLDRRQIESVQQELSSRGLYRGAIDGQVGPQTLAALQSFQAQQGLPAHARLDAQTRRALGLPLEMQPVSGTEAASDPGLEPSVGRDGAAPGASGSSAPQQLDGLDQQQLGALQTRLSELGFYRGTVDGKLGTATRSALQRYFQAQAELASRGLLTEATARLLGVEPRTTPSHSTGSNEPAATMPHPQPSTP
jgi:peptidoglycan hydrolase-like protein with peptidoglycan-binding domain